jgi:hypothetical protein
MTGSVPPLIEPPKSIVGLGTRELIILLVAAAVIFAVVVAPVDVVVKVGVGVLTGGLGLVLAFGREPRSGKTFEMYLFQIVQYHSRVRFHMRGAADTPAEPQPSPIFEQPKPSRGSRKPAPARSEPAAQPTGTVFQGPTVEATQFSPYSGNIDAPGNRPVLATFKPIPLSGATLLMVFSVAFLAALICWVWTGGLATFFYYYR